MNFEWENWIYVFILGQKIIPYICDIEFYDTGITVNYLTDET